MRRTSYTCWISAVALLLGAATAFAAGPRWVAGPSWTNNTRAMGWYRNDVQYFVDSGPLSAAVDHDTAVALVDAAASVWSLPQVPFSLNDGGSLAEDVSGSNVYLGANGPVWPADVQSGNYTAKQIAVVFDADGTITDTLLGSGASAPANCRTAAVTESVDRFIQPGKIAHAIVVLNGRCTGPAPEQQLQLRYQLMRTFGRVIGLGWSQLNDNVFTGTPVPTYQDQMHWPIMHPIDILCGPYSYQCMPQPFTLREDDVASVAQVYASDLRQSNADGVTVLGWLRFPNGQGMNGVNVVAHRNWPEESYGTEAFGVVSAVTGAYSPGDFGNPVTGAPGDPDDKQGSIYGSGAGFYAVYRVPALQFAYTSVIIQTEPINPLYTGQYAVGPYRAGAVAPAGDSTGFFYFGDQPGAVDGGNTLTPANAPYQCATQSDGSESAPARMPDGGMWSGLFCGTQHTAWTGLAVHAGRTATVEVTATDAAGTATMAKAMPVIGLWHAADDTGTVPTLARTAAFNSVRMGTTQLRASFAVDEQLRLAVADQRGDGRPDYLYRARFLYADAVVPARLPGNGGSIRITGSGFTPSCTVTVGGVAATVLSQTPTELVATAPPLTALNGTAVNDVAVIDVGTNGSTTITAGLTYNGAANDVLSLVSSPPSPTPVGAAGTFAVRLVDSTGQPAPNGSIVVSAAGGQATFDVCGLSTCTLLTDGSGLAQARVTARSAGTVVLTATANSGSTVQTTFLAAAPPQSVTLLRPMQYVAAGAGAVFHPEAQTTGNASSAAVTWQATSQDVAFGSVHAAGASSRVDATGSLRDGEVAAVQACAAPAVCASGTVTGVAAADLRVVVVSGDAQSVGSTASLQSVTVRVTDTAMHPVAGASVGVYQRVSGWQPPCTGAGRCPVAPVYGTSTSTTMSDDDGLVTITPLQYASTAALSRITATAGTTGVLTITLQKAP